MFSFPKHLFLLRPSPALHQYFSSWSGGEEAGAGSKARRVAGVKWLKQQLTHRKVIWFRGSCTGLWLILSLPHPFFCSLKFALSGTWMFQAKVFSEMIRSIAVVLYWLGMAVSNVEKIRFLLCLKHEGLSCLLLLNSKHNSRGGISNVNAKYKWIQIQEWFIWKYYRNQFLAAQYWKHADTCKYARKWACHENNFISCCAQVVPSSQSR